VIQICIEMCMMACCHVLQRSAVGLRTTALQVSLSPALNCPTPQSIPSTIWKPGKGCQVRPPQVGKAIPCVGFRLCHTYERRYFWKMETCDCDGPEPSSEDSDCTVILIRSAARAQKTSWTISDLACSSLCSRHYGWRNGELGEFEDYA
jgi:hypothetical protein